MSDHLTSKPLCAPTKEELIQFLTAWEGVGQLQTFGSREKFRKEARYFIQKLGLSEPPTERRFAVGDEVTIAHWGDTSKIVSITCRLEDGSTVDLESGCVAVTKSPSLSDHCPCGAISPAPGYACDRCSREAVETSLTHHTTWAAGENGLCKHCGLSWYLHIAEDGQGRKDVCTSLRATVSEKGDL
jgi:hypothetical protein